MPTAYSRNFLVNVIWRADFPLNLRLGSEKPIEFQERLPAAFPKAGEGIILQGEFSGETPQNVSLKQSIAQWEFNTRDMGSRVNLRRDFLSVETPKYVDFEQF